MTALTFGNVHGVYKPGNVKLRPEILKQAQEAVVEKLGLEAGAQAVRPGLPRRLRLAGRGDRRRRVDYGVVKMNVDTDTQYAFTRPVAGHMFAQLRRRAQGRRRGRQQEGLRPARLGQGRRGRHGRPRRRGLREPPQHRHQRQRLTRTGPHGGTPCGHNGAMTFQDLMAGPPPTHLPADPAAAELAAGTARGRRRPRATRSRRSPGRRWPSRRSARRRRGLIDVTAYAYARVGYHRSLDLLRRNGWKGHGPVPWEHEPNRGFLRALAALARAADRIGEAPEAQRCARLPARQQPRGVRRPPRLTRRPPPAPAVTRGYGRSTRGTPLANRPRA